ncbi:VacJ family lipoprotein [Planktomarina sp.]|nr:VacJ family lipoprotein [bacterium]MDB4168908.1 VacJ family lipoprotein [Planktomarina sp.]
MIERLSVFAIASLVMVVSACSPRQGAVADDPFERVNRGTHAFNKSLDRNILSPLSKTYADVVPDPVEDSVSSFASNLSLPGKVVNNVLQLDLSSAATNTARFVINSSVGLAGLFDPSQKIGLAEKDTDFGETLQGWGVAEGAYLELPVFGPSNLRDGLALFVDMLLLDPAGQILKPPVSEYRTASTMGAVLQKRQIYGAQIDEVLYDSADSYAQSRLVYLQSRRFELKDIANDAYIDPYAELE